MDHERQPSLRAELDVSPEDGTLHIARGVVVVVVESALPDCDGTVSREAANELQVSPPVESFSVVWMNARSVPDEPCIVRRDSLRRASGAEDVPGAAAGADADYCFGSVLLRAANYIAAVAVERLVCEVRVAVDERCDTDVFFGHFL